MVVDYFIAVEACPHDKLPDE